MRLRNRLLHWTAGVLPLCILAWWFGWHSPAGDGGGRQKVVMAAAVSSDGVSLVTADQSGILERWDLASGRLLAQANSGLSSVWETLEIDPRNRTLLVGGNRRARGMPYEWRIFDAESLTRVGVLPGATGLSWPNWLPDGRVAYVERGRNALILCEGGEGGYREARSWPIPTGHGGLLYLHCDGKRIWMCSRYDHDGEETRAILAFDLAGGVETVALTGIPAKTSRPLASDPSTGELAIRNGETAIEVYGLDPWRLRGRLRHDHAVGFRIGAFNRKGHLALASEHLEVWDWRAGRRIATDPMCSAEYAAWEARRGIVRETAGHVMKVANDFMPWAFAYVADGRRLVSALGKGDVFVWDAEQSYKRIRTLNLARD